MARSYKVTAEMEHAGFDSGAKQVKSQINSLSQLGQTLGKSFKVSGDFSKVEDGLKALQKGSVMATSEVERLTKNLAIAKANNVGDAGVRELEAELARAKTSAEKLATAEQQLKNSTKEVGDVAQKTGDGFTVMKGAMANLVSSGIQSSINGLKSALSGLGSMVVGLGKQVVSAYSDWEQLSGGVETLFKGSADAVKKDANEAFQTAGMSANEYMDTVTGFSASLISSLSGDTDKAAKIAKVALVDMSDNANKMGTSMDLIKNSYQGFAKGNFSMLDNLKLGYGGTKTEMERLLADAQKLSGQKYDISSFADIAQAIHVVQENLGITGTTAKEAQTTIEGSFNSLKASWTNLMAGFGNSKVDLQPLVQDVVNGAVTLVQNVTPVIEQLFKALPSAVTNLVQQIPDLLDILLPEIDNIIIALAQAVTTALPQVTQAIVTNLPTILESLINGAKQIVEALAVAIPQLIPVIGEAFIQLFTAFLEVLPTIITNLVPAIAQLINQLVNAIPPLIPLLMDAFIVLFNALIDALPVIINNLVPQIPVIIDALIEALPTMISALVQGFVELFTALIEATPTIIKTLAPEIPKIIQALADGFIQANDELNAGFQRLWDEFVAHLPEILQSIGDAFVDIGTWIWNAMVGGLNDAWNNFQGWLGDLGDSISSGISNIGSWLSGGSGGGGSFFASAPPVGMLNGIDPWSMPKGLMNGHLPLNLQAFAGVGAGGFLGGVQNAIHNVRKSSQQAVNQNRTAIFNMTLNGSNASDGGKAEIIKLLRKNGFKINFT